MVRARMAVLFEAPATFEHIMNMLKARELCWQATESADRSHEAAKVITDIVVTMT